MKRIMKSNKLMGKTYSLNPFTTNSITEEYIAWLNDPIVNKSHIIFESLFLV